MPPSAGYTIGGAASATTAPLAILNQQADIAADFIPIYSAALQGTYAVNIENLLGIASQVVAINDTQTLTHKTLTSPAVNGMTLNGNVTGTYTLGGTPTISSPTINSPAITGGSIAIDSIQGQSVSNTGTIYGMAISSGQLTAAAFGNNVVPAAALATNAIRLGYAQLTVGPTTSSTSVTSTGLGVTVTIPSGGRGVKILVWTPTVTNNTNGDGTNVSIWDGPVGTGTLLAQANIYQPAAAQMQVPVIVMACPPTPSPGSKTYNVGFNAVTGGTSTFGAGSNSPAFILIEAD